MDQKAVSAILGSSVMTDTQVRLGDVTDVFVDLNEQRLVKFEVDWAAERRAVSGSEENLPYTQVIRFDPHFLIVSGEIANTAGLDLIPFSEGGNVLAAKALLDRPLIDPEGTRIGTIVDIFFNLDDGAIGGYEVVPAGEEGRSLILPPTSDMEITARGIVIPERDKEAMGAGRLKISTWEGEIAEEEYEVIGEDLPDRESNRPEPFDILGSQPAIPVKQYDEASAFSDEERFSIYEGLPQDNPLGGPHCFVSEHPAVPIQEDEDEDRELD